METLRILEMDASAPYNDTSTKNFTPHGQLRKACVIGFGVRACTKKNNCTREKNDFVAMDFLISVSTEEKPVTVMSTLAILFMGKLSDKPFTRSVS